MTKAKKLLIADNAALIIAVLYIFISALLYSSTVFLFILLLPINSINLLTSAFVIRVIILTNKVPPALAKAVIMPLSIKN